jgi:hypothetical protein
MGGGKFDGLVKSRHTGVQYFCNMFKFLDSGVRRNDVMIVLCKDRACSEIQRTPDLRHL